MNEARWRGWGVYVRSNNTSAREDIMRGKEDEKRVHADCYLGARRREGQEAVCIGSNRRSTRENRMQGTRRAHSYAYDYRPFGWPGAG